MKKLFAILFLFTLSWTSLYANNYALTFDGADHYITLGDNFDDLNHITFEAVIKIDPTGGVRNLLRKERRFAWFIRDNKLEVQFSDGNTWLNTHIIGSSTVLPNNEWIHVATTFNAATGEMKFFINGEQDKAATVDNPPVAVDNNEPFYIGNNSSAIDGILNFDGTIDEVRIWNVVRTEAELQANKAKELDGNETNLVGYYTFNAISGTTLSDDSTNSYTGTLVNFDASWALPASNTVNLATKRLLFDGMNDYIDLGDTFEGVYAFTVAAWVKWDGIWDGKNYEAVVHKDLSFGAGLRSNNGSAKWHTNVIGSNVILDSATPITPNTWVHVATTRDAAGTMKMYIDGVLDANTINTTFTSVNNNNSLYIGQRDESGTIDAHFNGNIARVAFFTKELNITEINTLKDTTLNGTEDGLFASYPLSEGGGSVAKDSSSTQNDGTIYGATWTVSDLNNTDIFVKEGATTIHQFSASTDSWAMPLYSVDAGTDTDKFTIDSVQVS